MKLQKRWLLGGLAALLLTTTACQKTNNSSAPEVEEGSTYMSVAINLNLNPEELLKAGDDSDDHNSKGHWEGRDKINGVDIYIVDTNKGTVLSKALNVLTPPAGGASSAAGTDGVYATGAWKVEPGANKQLYAVVNNSGDIKVALDQAASSGAGRFIDAYNAAYEYTISDYAKEEGSPTKDVILMSSQPQKITIKEGISQSEATIETPGTADASKNQFQLEVRRSAARVAVTYDDTKVPAGVNEIKRGTTTFGTVKIEGWYYGQYEKTTALQWDLSAVDQSGASKNTLHRKTKSPNWRFLVTASTQAADRTSKYDYSTLANDKKVDMKPLSAGGATIENIIKDGNMQFLTETTHQYGTESTTHYRKGNTPYVLIETVFKPADGSWATAEEKDSYVAGTDGNYPDLYYSTFNGKFYTSLNNARNANPATAGKTFGENDPDVVVKYTGGKMYYFAWLNPDNAAKATEWLNSPVIRNNIYHIHVTGFKKPGMSGDPFNPSTDNDKPVDPDDDVPSIDEKLYIKETFASFEITVVNWGVHSYDITF